MVCLREDQCGTPQMRSQGSEVKGARLMDWVLPVRKVKIHQRVGPWSPMSCRCWERMGWETMSNAVERSNRMRAGVSSLSRIRLLSSVAVMS